MSWKLAVAKFFRHRGRLMLMSRLMGSTSVGQNKKWLFYNFSLHSSRGRLMLRGRLTECASQRIQHAVQSLLSWVDSWGRLKYINMIFFQNTYSKILKLSPINYKSCVLALEASESELDKIMILLLKYNKSFFKPRSLVTSSNAL